MLDEKDDGFIPGCIYMRVCYHQLATIRPYGNSAGVYCASISSFKDRYHNLHLKIKFAAMPAGQKRQFVEEIRASFLTKFGQCHLNSPAGYEWKDENGNIVYFPFPNSSLEIEYTSENWLKFLRGETTTYSPAAKIKLRHEDTFPVSQESQFPLPNSTATIPSPASVEEKRKELSIGERNKPALVPDLIRGTQEVTEHHGKEIQQNPGEESNPADLQISKYFLTVQEFLTEPGEIRPIIMTIKMLLKDWFSLRLKAGTRF